MDYYSRFAPRLNQIMIEKGLNQTELSRRTGLDKSLISNYVNGKYRPKEENLILIAKVLNVDKAWLMGYDVDKSTDELLQNKDFLLTKYIKDLSRDAIQKELLIKCTMLDNINEEKILEIVNMYLKEQGDYYENKNH